MADEATTATTEEQEEEYVQHDLEELRRQNQERIRRFQRKARNRGIGYQCPNFPIFNAKMEGLESGMYLVAGESNHGKSGLLLSLAWDYMAHENNHLYLVYFALDDTADDIYPRVIGMNQDIPISVSSKPTLYERKRDMGDDNVALYNSWLTRGQAGIDQLLDVGEKFTLLDGTDISCGEDILERCKDIKALVRTEDRQANIIVAIDSGMDIEWRDKKFKSEKELNDYTARQLKKWAVEILDCPLFVTLHLRKIEQNRRPTVADIKESGRWVYEASWLGLVHNDVSRNKQSAAICVRDEQGEVIPVIELNWAKNKKSSFKGTTYQTFITNHSLVKECTETMAQRFDSLIYAS